MTLYEKFGWIIPVESYLESFEAAKSPPLRVDSIPDKKGDAPSSATNVAVCYYLQGERDQAKKFAREAVDAVIDYFYGDWTKQVPTDLGTLDPGWWRLHMSWMDFFSEGVCWAAAIGDWKSLKKIADYPSDDCDGYTKEDRAAYLALASVLRGESMASQQRYLQEIQNRKKEKPKLIAEVIKALQSNSQARFQASLEGYLQYFRKSEFKKKSLGKLLTFDGTTLLNIGRRNGLQFKVPPELEDHIIRLD